MRTHRICLSAAAVAIIGNITLQSPAHSEEYRGTWEQQMACTPDVWRLCGAQVPDVDRIVACLQRMLTNSANGVTPCLPKAAARPDVARIASTGKGVSTGTTARGVITGTTSRGLIRSTGRDHTTMTTTNRGCRLIDREVYLSSAHKEDDNHHRRKDRLHE